MCTHRTLVGVQRAWRLTAEAKASMLSCSLANSRAPSSSNGCEHYTCVALPINWEVCADLQGLTGVYGTSACWMSWALGLMGCRCSRTGCATCTAVAHGRWTRNTPYCGTSTIGLVALLWDLNTSGTVWVCARILHCRRGARCCMHPHVQSSRELWSDNLE